MKRDVGRRAVQLAALSVVFAGTSVAAQQAVPGGAASAPDVGQMAPDFTLPGASRYGLVKDPVHLSDLRGQTVVVAFFPKARTKG